MSRLMRIISDELKILYDTTDDGKNSALMVVRYNDDKTEMTILNEFADEDADQLYWKLTGAKTEPGCMERNIWGKIERGKLLCKDCGHTYDSKAVCSAVKKRRFLVEE